MTEKEKMQSGQLYAADTDPELIADRAACKDKCWAYNQMRYTDWDSRNALLRELLGSTYVRRSYASMELPVPCVQIFLTADDGAPFTLAVGENGRVILSDHSGSAANSTCWKTDSPALYRSLLSAAGTES